MEPIVVGFLSVLPPLIAITLALTTKDVVTSLVLGILSGAFIYTFSTDGSLIQVVDYTVTLMAKEFNVMMILFMCLLGILVAVITMAGGSSSYGEWASKKIKSRTGAQLGTSALGAIIFIDDYFNCLTVGTVMRPVTDRYKISREKLAYVIDSTAAPVCIIAPISSWAASVVSYMSDTGIEGMSAFVATIPYNIYAILTIIMLILLAIFKLDFGPMRRADERALRGDIDDTNYKVKISTDELDNIKGSERGRVFDLAIPILALIVLTTLAMLYTGGYFATDISISKAFGATDSSKSLVLGGFGAIVIAFFLFLPRKVITFREFMSGVSVGVKSMVPACIILTLAWTIKGICTALSTGTYVSAIVESSAMPIALIPVVVFIVAAILSFSIGTSWGTFGILIPIIVVVTNAVAPELLIISLSAVLAGSIFGDHCSPISDTTILSSTGAGCDHIRHVATQIPYAILVASCSLVGYFVAGFTRNLFLTLSVSIILLIVSLIVARKISDIGVAKNRG